MRPCFLLIPFVYIFLITPAYAQKSRDVRDSTRKFCITTNLPGLFSLGVEYKVAPRTSIYISPRTFTFQFYNTTTFNSLTADYRYYISKGRALNGFYLGPYLKLRHRKVTDHVDEVDLNNDNDHRKLVAKATLLGGGITSGYQKVFNGGFVLSFYTGVGYTFYISKNENLPGYENYLEEIIQLDVRLGGAIGYAF
jgi:hypothetical protein